MKREITSETIDARIAFVTMMFPKRISSAAMCYIGLVGHIAIDESKIPGVIDDSKLINLGDTPATPEQKEAHKRLLNYVAERFEISPEELYKAKQSILEACDPTDY